MILNSEPINWFSGFDTLIQCYVIYFPHSANEIKTVYVNCLSRKSKKKQFENWFQKNGNRFKDYNQGSILRKINFFRRISFYYEIIYLKDKTSKVLIFQTSSSYFPNPSSHHEYFLPKVCCSPCGAIECLRPGIDSEFRPGFFAVLDGQRAWQASQLATSLSINARTYHPRSHTFKSVGMYRQIKMVDGGRKMITNNYPILTRNIPSIWTPMIKQDWLNPALIWSYKVIG